MMTKFNKGKQQPPTSVDVDDGVDDIVHLNASGHVQELDRNFGFWSICAVSVVADNAWAAGGGSLVWLLNSCISK
jgi:hypothetical protein